MSGSSDEKSAHPEMRTVAGEEAAAVGEEGVQTASDPPSVSLHAPPTALVETYRDQVEQNQEAHRQMRWWAFIAVGALSILYLVGLLCVLWRFFDTKTLTAVLGASGGSLSWHALFLVGLALIIFAAIPLSLAMAMVKMISERREESEVALKTPSTELGKILLDLMRSIIAAARS